MKITGKQKKIIDSIISIVKTWENTNDIDSPTHISDIEAFLYADLMDTLDDDEIVTIADDISDLYWDIKRNQ
jgi:hypothetical protein